MITTQFHSTTDIRLDQLSDLTPENVPANIYVSPS